MRPGLPIGRLFGIRLRAHPSWFIVLALIIVSLAAIGVPGEEIASEQRWAIGLAVAGSFFLSVLVHELAHALVARRVGVPVEEVTLFIFGGPPGVERDAPSPRAEAAIAAAGPALSLAIALVGLALWGVLEPIPGDAARVAAGVAWWVASSNLLLGVFNLVPGFPMDGGRLLRAVVWGITRDYMRATRVAALTGRAFGYGLIAAGVAWALAGEIILGIWLALIGWFLNQAAEGSYRRIEFGRLVEGISVRDVMEQDVAVVSPNLTLDTLVEQHLMSGRASLYPVTTDGELVGTVDLGQVGRVRRSDWPSTRVTDVMTRGEQMSTLTLPAPVMDAMTRFEETGAPAIPVVAEENRRQLLGLVTRDGLIRALRTRAGLRRRGSGQ